MKTFNLIMLSGLPGSGKTTMRKKILQKFPKFLALSTDDYIEYMAKLKQQTYSELFRSQIKEAERNFKARLSCIIQDFNGGNESEYAIIDQTNLRDKTRKKKLDSIKQRCRGKVTSTLIILDTDFDTILERNLERVNTGRHLMLDVLYDMDSKFDKTKTEGFDFHYIMKE